MADIVPARTGRLAADGYEIHWEYHGTGTREVVCLLNGLAMHTRAWYGFLPLLSDQHDVLLFDYPGQGESSSPDEPYSILRFADYLAAIADTLGIARLHVMGISYGGFVALEFARRYHHRLHTLMLSGILLSHEELFEMYEALSLRFYRGGEVGLDLYTHYMYEKIFGEAFVRRTKPQLEGMRQKFHARYASRVWSLIRLTDAQDAYFGMLDDILPDFRLVSVPTLILAGGDDRVISWRVQRKICGILPTTRFEIVDDCGHVVYLERPAFFFDTMKAFAREKRLDFALPPSA
jgi:pimeloyl-ACP methyl ester carboxylesterase